jgi:ABC-type nitrate/sulfonate/bicarbonate transport system ATPase subunit
MAIILNQVVKCYNDVPILDHLDLILPLNGIVCLTGPSGCGKTTLMRLVAGFEKPDSGTIVGASGLVFATVFQDDRLVPWLTAAENLDRVLQQTSSIHFLDLIHLTDAKDKFPNELSGGMRRRIALARALAFPGDILFLDEPFKGLDDILRDEMMDLVRLERGKRPVFIITHDEYEAKVLSDVIFHFEGPPLRLVDQIH